MLSAIEFIITLLRMGLSFVIFNVVNLVIPYWPFVARPVVKVKQGQVQGITSKLPNGKPYHYFKGIPYAKPPVGELRFRAPIPLEKFSKPLLNCSSDKGFAMQDFVLTQWPIVGTEDSLYLNVYTPGLQGDPKSGKFPVMVYIHGGGFRYGTANAFVYEPSHLLQQGVIVVTVFHRVGPLGFLCLPEAGISGNAGLKDQLLALRWVQENISNFGGDSENVTLIGESAGSWATYMHYLSPNSRKYFHRIICQSGDFCTDAMIQVDPEEKARKLAKVLRCTEKSDQKILDFLIKAPASAIVKSQNKVIHPSEEGLFERFVFRPVIEQHLTDDSIITQSPEEILKTFDTLRMPIMSGCNTAEGTLVLELNQNRLTELNKHPEWLAPRFLGSSKELNKSSIGTEVKQFYLGSKDITWKTVKESCTMFSDITFNGSNNLSAEMLAKHQPNVAHFVYNFSFKGKFNLVSKYMNVGPIDDAGHGDDIFYTFNSSALPQLPSDSDECKVRDILIQLLTNFAKFGDPTPAKSDLGFKWTPVKPVSKSSKDFDLDCLDINTLPRMVRNQNQERKEFVRSLLRKHTNLI